MGAVQALVPGEEQNSRNKTIEIVGRDKVDADPAFDERLAQLWSGVPQE